MLDFWLTFSFFDVDRYWDILPFPGAMFSLFALTKKCSFDFFLMKKKTLRNTSKNSSHGRVLSWNSHDITALASIDQGKKLINQTYIPRLVFSHPGKGCCQLPQGWEWLFWSKRLIIDPYLRNSSGFYYLKGSSMTYLRNGSGYCDGKDSSITLTSGMAVASVTKSSSSSVVASHWSMSMYPVLKSRHLQKNVVEW